MIEQGVSLKTYNSFGVAAEAALFAVAKTIEDLQSILKDKRFASAWILGGGSNTLFCNCLLYTSPSPRDGLLSRMPSSA